MPSESLREYQAKRDFQRTAEPSGDDNQRQSSAEPVFVVQRHEARALHYDFRLEVEGVLVSWAVPKGPPQKAGVRRLAVQTEDHPLAYASFAGQIPKGEYGAGKVEIWDNGVYRNLRAEKGDDETTTMSAAVIEGKIEVYLEGQKLKGPYVLIRTDDAERQWIMQRMKAR